MGDFDPTRLLPYCRSLVGTSPGFAAIHRDRFLETEADPDTREALAAEADAWVAEAGGYRFDVRPPASRGLRPGRVLAPSRPAATGFYGVPKARLPEEPPS